MVTLTTPAVHATDHGWSWVMDADGFADHTRRNALMTILGNAQLLRRRILRSPGLAPSEREIMLQEIAAIERAIQALQQGPASPSTPTEAAPDDAS